MALIKHRVCVDCLTHDINLTPDNCICTYKDYDTIELEFESCDCCGHVEAEHADTPFNEKQIEKLEKS